MSLLSPIVVGRLRNWCSRLPGQAKHYEVSVGVRGTMSDRVPHAQIVFWRDRKRDKYDQVRESLVLTLSRPSLQLLVQELVELQAQLRDPVDSDKETIWPKAIGDVISPGEPVANRWPGGEV